jgi:hypothetical protein
MLVATFMSARRVHPLIIVPIAAMMLPAFIAFEAYIYPAQPKSQMWAPIALAFGYVYGLAAATVVCVGFFIARKVRRRDV